MKKILVLIASIGSLFCGCTDANVEETLKFEFADGTNLSPKIAPSGGKTTIYFFSPSYWSATADSWISVSPRAGEAGNSSIVIKLSSNKTGETLNGTVTISLSNGESYVVSVSQESDDIFDSDSQNKYQIGISGGEINVKVTANIDYTVDIPKNAQSWLSLVDSRALREEDLTFKVAKNETYDTREAVVRLLDKERKVLQSFTVVQLCEDVFDTNANEEYAVSADGGSVEVVVATNIDYRVEIPSDTRSWIHLADTRAYRNEKLSFTIEKNENYESRTAIIKLLGDNGEALQVFSIKQAERKGLNTDAPTEYTVESDGGTLEVNVSTNIDYMVDIPEDAQSWVSLADTRTLRNEKLTFTIAANDKTTPRSTKVSIKNSDSAVLYEILIRQKERIIFDNSKDSGLYLGIIGFNKEQYYYPIQRLTSNSIKGYNSFIEKLAKGDIGTLLYKTMDKSINELQNNLFPEDLYNVSIVTFTDGLDEGSRTGTNYVVDTEYLSALNTRLTNETVSGKKIESYTVGVMGDDAMSNTQLFRSNLYNLATSEGNVFDTNNMSEVNEAFYEIAKKLGETNTYYSLEFHVTEPEHQAKCRFTFDDVTTYNASCKYIEGICNISIVNNEKVVTLDDIKYIGITAETGSNINFVRQGTSIFYKLEFEGIQANDGSPITQDKIQYWRTKQGSWGLNSEFDPNNNAILDKINRTAAIMLNLDCSGSLGDKFSTLQSSAKNFVSTLLNYASDPNNVEYVTLDNSAVTLPIGATTTLKATVFPDTALEKSVEWSSSNPEVATVNQNGIVTARAVGDATIRVKTKDRDRKASCIVSVVSNDRVIYYTSTDGNVVIPNSTDYFGANILFNTYQDGQGLIIFDVPVTSIGYKAFYNCTSLTSVTIPNSVTSIGGYAFFGCTSLTSVTIPNSVTSIGREAFKGCSSLTSVTIPNSVTSIGYSAFYNCTSLTSVTIPDSVTSIGDTAFYDCSSLTSVVIGNSVTSIGDHAFQNCTSLTSVTIPNSVTSIGGYAFFGCTSLTSVTIPNSVTSIGNRAFYGCSSLTSVTIPNSVTSIGEYAFYNCSSLTSVVIGNSVTSIGSYAFKSCTSLTSITIPNSVTSIGSSVFSNCTSLTTITIPNSVTSIGKGAFNGCAGKLIVDSKIVETNYTASGYPACDGDGGWLYGSAFTELTIGNSVTSIGSLAFCDCRSLTTITIPNSVTSIGERAFSGCTGELIINSKIVETDYTYDNYPANSNNGWLYNAKFTKVTIGNNITKIGNYAFFRCTSLTSVTIGDSVTSIGRTAFFRCTSLKSVTIPNSVTSIGGEAFYGCVSLTAFYGKYASADNRCLIANGVLNSFAIGCGATEYTIPDSVTSIGDSAFSDCTSLTTITIPNSVTSIRWFAFSGCTSLTSVYCKPTTPPTGDSNMFSSNASGRTIYVPRNSVEAYKAARYWSGYASDIVGYDF